MNITINEVAKEAKVSKGTVSRVLNNSPLVKEETKKRVNKIIKKLNYEPNFNAQSLITKKTKTIGLIIEDINNPFFSLIAKGIEEIARIKKYNIFLCSTNYSKQIEKQYLSMILRRRVDGIVITPIDSESANIRSLKESKTPFVMINSWSKDKDVNYIVNDNFRGAYKAVSHLIELGHKEIAFINGPRIQGCHERLKGYRKALKDTKIKYSSDLIIENVSNNDEAYKKTKDFLALNKSITAIFAVNDLVAIGAMKAIFDMNYRVPDDFSIIGYDNIEFSSILRVPLTTIDQQIYEQGEMGCEQLIKLIEAKNNYKPVRITIEPELIIRKTCARRRKGSLK